MLNNPPAPGSGGGGGRSGAGGLPPELAGLGAALGKQINQGSPGVNFTKH